MEYVSMAGIPKSKLNIGIPLYGQTFTLSTSRTDFGAPAKGRGEPGPFTLQAGMMGYSEICKGGMGWKDIVLYTVTVTALKSNKILC